MQSVTAEDALALTRLLARQTGTAFVAITPLGYHMLRAKPDVVAQALARLPERQRKLDLTQLHSLVLEQLLGITAEAIREQQNLRYVRDAGEAMEQVSRREADVAFLTNPITLGQLREVAFAGDVMPQKSTDFYQTAERSCYLCVGLSGESPPRDRACPDIRAGRRSAPRMLRRLPRGRAPNAPVCGGD